MISWTGLAPWEFEFSFSDSFTSTFLVGQHILLDVQGAVLTLVVRQ
jgi:hypothetical protein